MIALAALALFATTPALAAKGDKWLGLQFGGSFPTSDFKDAAKTGFEGGVVGDYMVAEQVGIGVLIATLAVNSGIALMRWRRQSRRANPSGPLRN